MHKHHGPHEEYRGGGRALAVEVHGLPGGWGIKNTHSQCQWAVFPPQSVHTERGAIAPTALRDACFSDKSQSFHSWTMGCHDE